MDWDPSSFLSARKLSGLWNSAHSNGGSHCNHSTSTLSQGMYLCYLLSVILISEILDLGRLRSCILMSICMNVVIRILYVSLKGLHFFSHNKSFD